MKPISRFLLASVSLLIACDPGYTYHPNDWQPVEKGYSWKKSLDGIDVNIYSFGGFLGSRSGRIARNRELGKLGESLAGITGDLKIRIDSLTVGLHFVLWSGFQAVLTFAG